eukprot:CAMPEP_0119054798 /NCGR_PEP_ID=MMETSP1177-20130426/75315_1 /TAXON_ID=2985 /ORGANISM="Ochromonas sp, Strain CCMP1899" /LENGTH=146 /DNA_ID=CAMNT_0007035167 /DNA_START=1318 /DNA_END=1755 /DNA_ORIENTATION=-
MVVNHTDFTVVTVGASCDTVVLWDYHGGKFEKELEVCDASETVVQITCLLPFPLVATSDSSGNILIFGTRGCKWSGRRISGLLNQTPLAAEYEQKGIKSEEELPLRAMIGPASSVASTGVCTLSTAKLTKQFSSNHFEYDSESVSE